MNTPALVPQPVPEDATCLRPLLRLALGRVAHAVGSDMQLRLHTVCDHDSDHYLLVAEGWQGYRRIYRTLVHMALQGDVLHVYEDGTVNGVVECLCAVGVPRERIICEWARGSLMNDAPHR
ncbi:MAG: XisI protein [Fibrella sp.]|nr:XisI protein [Armatimonadota bacterium]